MKENALNNVKSGEELRFKTPALRRLIGFQHPLYRSSFSSELSEHCRFGPGWSSYSSGLL